MNRAQFRRAYHAARIGQVNADTLESVAAIIALQDARKRDSINDRFAFALDLSGNYERIQKREEMKARCKVRRNAVGYRFDYSILNEE